MKVFLLGLAASLMLVSCAHTTMRGSVAMKATNDELHVCMGEQEVKAGDRVAFFSNDCEANRGRLGLGGVCKKIKVGEGEVLRTLGEHYSMVKPDLGIGAKVSEGTIVEKL